MSKHVIIATDSRPMQLRYFVGYRDAGDLCEVMWTVDAWQACWLDASEVAIETDLLAAFCPSLRLHYWTLDVIGTPKVD